MTRRPIDSIGWRTVVRGGSVQFMRKESSNPTTDTSPGTVIRARRAARIAPSAVGSLAQMIPVTLALRRPVAAVCAASSEYSEWTIWYDRRGIPARAAIALAAASFLVDGT